VEREELNNKNKHRCKITDKNYYILKATRITAVEIDEIMENIRIYIYIYKYGMTEKITQNE